MIQTTYQNLHSEFFYFNYVKYKKKIKILFPIRNSAIKKEQRNINKIKPILNIDA